MTSFLFSHFFFEAYFIRSKHLIYARLLYLHFSNSSVSDFCSIVSIQPSAHVHHAINTYSNPYELVAPILEIIADNPSVDFGMPGELVHFVEQFYKNGYEELLIASVSEKPTPHNIWMLHRCYNDINNPQRDKFAEVIRELKNEESISVEIKDAIDEFDWE